MNNMSKKSFGIFALFFVALVILMILVWVINAPKVEGKLELKFNVWIALCIGFAIAAIWSAMAYYSMTELTNQNEILKKNNEILNQGLDELKQKHIEEIAILKQQIGTPILYIEGLTEKGRFFMVESLFESEIPSGFNGRPAAPSITFHLQPLTEEGDAIGEVVSRIVPQVFFLSTEGLKQGAIIRGFLKYEGVDSRGESSYVQRVEVLKDDYFEKLREKKKKDEEKAAADEKKRKDEEATQKKKDQKKTLATLDKEKDKERSSPEKKPDSEKPPEKSKA